MSRWTRKNTKQQDVHLVLYCSELGCKIRAPERHVCWETAVFWNMTPCNKTGAQSLGGRCLHLQSRRLVGVGSTSRFIQAPDCTASRQCTDLPETNYCSAVLHVDVCYTEFHSCRSSNEGIAGRNLFTSFSKGCLSLRHRRTKVVSPDKALVV
jgi:hypothetical protein